MYSKTIILLFSLWVGSCELNRTAEEDFTELPREGYPDSDNGKVQGALKFEQARIDCVKRINDFRKTEGKEPFQRWIDGEACADEQAKYDSEGRGAHAGFRDKICESGWAQNECGSRRTIDNIIIGCLQSMWDEGPSPSGEWDVAHGHYMTMASTRHEMVACGFYEMPDGEIWALQNFK